ncbi:PREDICTED: nephrin-like [Dinoponera quadriceps]|uniref:Nephrin-like n=1 Tax=Dinoponera quadriceps TaxID=609295 RepID=A0A6P3XFZ7_DINQU|nr:PREDICTED: nephrin-like [Dinoponera quadriceps]XP_014477344.1 PREDICTED: nephrin-like [Dinoponera quadriceps]XP_014477345.1 PREDICTED: nephrin-like [Dinoponera quadriceps]XP_014477346.1 PREDICTED: nephrin-like [Dinoponera quadriceps]XP_014477347.1 PREDICTED: nephrin-like [Dinoponera quadriceps]XP_014477348.1 PREDICTED: nephrin-like [Dinoponera quadriceps]XP_014477349.1 PREDICTED: nephrin-like [Dinoponera quadriceps]XP_014477350.1 PREDICTED: nephrin-like [Dinoponera quadriceps]
MRGTDLSVPKCPAKVSPFGMALGTLAEIAVRLVIGGYIFAVVVYVNASDNWDKDDDIVSTSKVSAVLGRTATLPCDIEPSTREDRVYMVLWFRDYEKNPIYSFDVRGRAFNKALNWSDSTAVGPRAYFVTVTKPAALSLEAVQLDDEGIYRCRVDFKNSPTKNFQVNLTVIVPPHQLLIYDHSGVQLENTAGPFEVGEEFGLSCEVRGGKPTPVVSWLVNGEEVDGRLEEFGQNIVVSKLTVPQLRREHRDTTYKCRAANTHLIPPLEKTVILDVYLKPLIVKILSKLTILETEKDYSITCEATGSHPRARIIWLEGNTTFRSGKVMESGNASVVLSTLIFSPVPDDHGKMLKCRGINSALKNAFLEDQLKLNVVFPPKVQLHLGSTLNAENIKEGDDVYFECKVRANPEHHKITWRHNGAVLTQNYSAGIIMSTQSLVLQSIGRDNAGNYTCLASNDRGETTSPIVTLRVQFAPVCKMKEVTIIGASLEESVKVRCEVDADPSEVDFVWEFNNSGENFEVAPAKFDGNNGTMSELVYTPESERDYGALTCWGRNAIGKQEAPCIYQVIPAVKPNPLNNCTIKASLNQSAEILEVECVPGYDGGLHQEFRLEAYEVLTGNLRVNASSVSADLPIFRIAVADLLPATHFYLVTYAVNAKGRSEVSLLEDIMLRDSEKHTDTGVSMLPLILLLIGCLIAFGVTVLSVMLMMYRRRGTTSPVHIEPYMKQPIITPPDSRNNSMLDVTHGDHTYFVEYTLKQVTDYALNNQPDIIQSPQDQEKIKREPQLFLPVRPDTLFAPYDIHKQGLQTNRCSLNPFSAKSWEPISFKADRNLMKEIIIANSIPGPESCV